MMPFTLRSPFLHPGIRLVVLAVLPLVAGCVDLKGYSDSIATFQTGTTAVASSCGIYFQEANDREIEHYAYGLISKARARTDSQPFSPIVEQDMLDKQLLDREQLAVRLEALRQLATYCDLLRKLATSDAPDKIIQSGVQLTDSLNSLADTLAAKPFNAGSGPRFKAAVGLASAVFFEVASLAVELKIRKALDSAITTGSFFDMGDNTLTMLETKDRLPVETMRKIRTMCAGMAKPQFKTEQQLRHALSKSLSTIPPTLLAAGTSGSNASDDESEYQKYVDVICRRSLTGRIPDLIAVIRSDLDALHERRRTHNTIAMTSAIGDLNRELGKAHGGDRQVVDALKSQVRQLAADRAILESAPYSQALADLLDAYRALLFYANSRKLPTDLASLAGTLERFNARATRLATAVMILRQSFRHPSGSKE